MNILNNVKIRSRILILALFPTIVVCSFSIARLIDATYEQNSLQQLASAMTLAGQAGAVLKDVQSERDFTYGYLSGNPTGTLGARYKQPLAQQRRTVDQTISNFKQYIDKESAQLYQLEGIEHYVTRLLDNVAPVIDARQYIDKYQLKDSENKWVVNRYGNLQLPALGTINAVVRLAASNEELSLLIGTYAALMQLDYIYSFERSTKIRTLSQTKMDYTSVGNNKGDWRQILDANIRFRAYAPADINAMYEAHLSKPLQQKIHNMRRKLLQAGGTKYDMGVEEWFDDSTKNLESLRTIITHVEQKIETTTTKALAQAQSDVSQNTIIMICVVIIIMLISYFIINSIISPLRILVEEMGAVAKNKDVSKQIPIKGTDELAEVSTAFNSLQTNFNSAIHGVLSEVDNMNALTASVSNAMAENTNRVQSQNTETDSVSVAINEMTATIQEVASIAQDSATAVENAHETSISSAKNASDSKNIMESLIGELASTQEEVSQLNSEAEVIGNVLAVIQSIAEQTNLLALNAAIEAARAGEQGRGFAVVADEVRSLASRTQESTEQIRQQIDALQSGSRTATNSMVHLQQQGTKAVEVVVNSVEAFEVLKVELDNISAMASQIATAAEEQTVVAEEINQRIHIIKDDSDEMTAQTAATSTACDELEQTGETLNNYVHQFKVSE